MLAERIMNIKTIENHDVRPSSGGMLALKAICTPSPPLTLRLSGGIQGWVPVSKPKESAASKSKRQVRVEKGRMVKDMKRKFKASTKRRSQRARRLQSRDDAAALAAAKERDAERPRLAAPRATAAAAAQPAAVRSAGWTASEEDSTLEILDRSGNRIPIHPAKGLHAMHGARVARPPVAAAACRASATRLRNRDRMPSNHGRSSHAVQGRGPHAG
jgi:hypothetical protein